MYWFSTTLRRLRQAALLLICASSLVLAAPAATGAVHAQTTGPTYVVQPGDTLFDIALSFGISVDTLQAANPGTDPKTLSVGQTLVIPGFEGLTGTLNRHGLEPGETLDSLSLRLGLKRTSLVRLNGIVNPDWMFINESMVTVDAPDAPAVPTSTTYQLVPGEGLLAFAAAHNQNPWALAAANRLSDTAVVAPGSSFWVPGGARATRALAYPLLAVSLRPFPAVQGRTLRFRWTRRCP